MQGIPTLIMTTSVLVGLIKIYHTFCVVFQKKHAAPSQLCNENTHMPLWRFFCLPKLSRPKNKSLQGSRLKEFTNPSISPPPLSFPQKTIHAEPSRKKCPQNSNKKRQQKQQLPQNHSVCFCQSRHHDDVFLGWWYWKWTWISAIGRVEGHVSQDSIVGSSAFVVKKIHKTRSFNNKNPWKPWVLEEIPFFFGRW